MKYSYSWNRMIEQNAEDQTRQDGGTNRNLQVFQEFKRGVIDRVVE